jgi:hypothetical protein
LPKSPNLLLSKKDNPQKSSSQGNTALYIIKKEEGFLYSKNGHPLYQ